MLMLFLKLTLVVAIAIVVLVVAAFLLKVAFVAAQPMLENDGTVERRALE